MHEWLFGCAVSVVFGRLMEMKPSTGYMEMHLHEGFGGYPNIGWSRDAVSSIITIQS